MARAMWLVLLTPILVALGLIPEAAANSEPAPPPSEVPQIRLGVLKGMFRDTPADLIQAVAQPFRSLFKKQTGLGGDVTVLPDCEALASEMKNKKVDIGVFHGFEFAWVRNRYPELVPLVTAVPKYNPQACIVVNASSKLMSAEQLKGVSLAVPTGTKAHCDLYVDHLHANLPMGACQMTKFDGGSDDALEAVAREKETAALVDYAALKRYENNYPGIAKQLKILCQSKPLPAAIVVYRKESLHDEVIEKIRVGLLDAKKQAQGRAFLFLWKLEGFSNVTTAYEKLLVHVSDTYPPPQQK